MKAKIEIIYEDERILVVNKPSGISVTADRTGAAQLTDVLNGQLGEAAVKQLLLIHRLDKQTSGCLMLAKTKEAQSKFSSFFAKKRIKKTYLALVTGIAPCEQGKINARIIRDVKRPNQMHLTRKKGKEASTRWKLLADFEIASLLAVSPITGRTHQLRVHLPSIGLPLAIDPLYGNSRPIFLSDFKHGYRLGKKQTEKPLIDRLTLHAYQLELEYPEPNQPDCFIAGLDKKFKATLKMMTKHNPNGQDAFNDPDNFEKIINAERLQTI